MEATGYRMQELVECVVVGDLLNREPGDVVATEKAKSDGCYRCRDGLRDVHGGRRDRAPRCAVAGFQAAWLS
jgi:hypothetical protein